jgi:predicted alpha/beta-hydrolase family hydrolase
VTPEWPGVPDTVAEARERPETQAGVGIDDVIEHHARLVAALPEPPVLVGHSFGGHSLTVDAGWREVAGAALEWLETQGIGGQTPPP